MQIIPFHRGAIFPKAYSRMHDDSHLQSGVACRSTRHCIVLVIVDSTKRNGFYWNDDADLVVFISTTFATTSYNSVLLS